MKKITKWYQCVRCGWIENLTDLMRIEDEYYCSSCGKSHEGWHPIDPIIHGSSEDSYLQAVGNYIDDILRAKGLI